MIQIEVNRYTIAKLEEAMEKHNKETDWRKDEYSDIIEYLCESYTSETKKENFGTRKSSTK